MSIETYFTKLSSHTVAAKIDVKLCVHTCTYQGPRVNQVVPHTFGRHFNTSWLNWCIVLHYQVYGNIQICDLRTFLKFCVQFEAFWRQTIFIFRHVELKFWPCMIWFPPWTLMYGPELHRPQWSTRRSTFQVVTGVLSVKMLRVTQVHYSAVLSVN